MVHGRTPNACSVGSPTEPVQGCKSTSWNFSSWSLQLWFRLIQIGRPLSLPSVSIWRRVILSDSGASPPRLSMNVPVQSTSLTARESCCMSSEACCACSCQGSYLCCRIGHRSPPLCLYLSLVTLFFPFFISINLSICLSPDSVFLPHPPPFSLFCTDTLVKSAHYVLRWPCIAFYIWHKAVNDTEKREHMRRKRRRWSSRRKKRLMFW